MANTVLVTPLNIELVNLADQREVNTFHDAWIASGQEKMLDDFRRLREMGIVDARGNQLKDVVPTDMLDPNADFGG